MEWLWRFNVVQGESEYFLEGITCHVHTNEHNVVLTREENNYLYFLFFFASPEICHRELQKKKENLNLISGLIQIYFGRKRMLFHNCLGIYIPHLILSVVFQGLPSFYSWKNRHKTLLINGIILNPDLSQSKIHTILSHSHVPLMLRFRI